jgi:type I restriction enzyme M protein
MVRPVGPSGSISPASQAVNPAEPIAIIPAGKIRCYVHPDVLRSDTPEEHIRQRVARSLVEEYGYDRADLHLEFPIKVGSGVRRRIDIVIFPPSQPHVQEHVFIIVEAKREDTRPTDRNEGIAQLKFYLAACINARWGLWVGSEMVAIEKEVDLERAKKHPFIEATDIPLKGATEPKRLAFSELVPATAGLRSVFKRCHNYLHVNGNLSKEKAFFELLKLIFCKIHDEQESETLDFCVTTEERRSDLGQRKLKARIIKLFDAVKDRYPYIFPSRGESIELDNRSLSYCVSELQKFSLLETPSDVKGEAYEEIVGVTSRRDQGAFFTPRNVCDMAVQMVMATYSVERRLRLKILDPACGTGGFLRAALMELRKVIEQQEHAKWGKNRDKASGHISERLKRLCDENLFGIDKLAELVRAAQMNLAMHGDGSSNVFHANSLLPPGEWPEAIRESKISLNHFDVCFTNPPFGSKLPVDDPHILDQFDLSRHESKSARSAMPPEQLFIERCLRFLKPGGRMAIVLPDSILSNPGLAWLRHWMLQHAWIIASVDLPREMFAKSDTHTMTSVLLLQRFTPEEQRLVARVGQPEDYEIFMAIADRVGWDLRGQPVFLRTEEGEEIYRKTQRRVTSRNARGDVVEMIRDVEEPIINDQLPAVTALFVRWLQEHGPQRWMNA